jgi:hypothetical protein
MKQNEFNLRVFNDKVQLRKNNLYIKDLTFEQAESFLRNELGQSAVETFKENKTINWCRF